MFNLAKLSRFTGSLLLVTTVIMVMYGGGKFGVNCLTSDEIDGMTLLTCTDSGFVVTMDNDLVLDGTNGGDFILYIGNSGLCNYTGTDNERIYKDAANNVYVFNFTYPGCDTTRGYTADRLTFDNTVGRSPFYIEGQAPIITRMQDIRVDVSCIYNLKGTAVSTSYQIQNDPITDDLQGEGLITLRMDIFKSIEYSVPYADSPLYVNRGKTLWYQISQTGQLTDLELLAENCTLSDKPDLTASGVRIEHVLENGCAVSDLYTPIDSTDFPDKVRFQMPAVSFFEEVNQAYVTCTVFVCNSNDLDSECKRERTCNGTQRARRYSDETFGTFYSYESREIIESRRIITQTLDPNDDDATEVLDPISTDGSALTAATVGAGAGVVVGGSGVVADRC